MAADWQEVVRIRVLRQSVRQRVQPLLISALREHLSEELTVFVLFLGQLVEPLQRHFRYAQLLVLPVEEARRAELLVGRVLHSSQAQSIIELVGRF